MQINFNVSSLDSIPYELLESNFINLINCNQPFDSSNITVYFSDNTLRDVKAFQEEKGLPIIGHSKDAKGKVLHYRENGKLNHAIFLDYDTFSPFIFKNIDEAYFEAFLINHEMGHIFEYSLTSSFLPLQVQFDSVIESCKEICLYQQSSAIFSEFITNYFAMNYLLKLEEFPQKYSKVLNGFYSLLHKYIEDIPGLMERAKNEVINTRNGEVIQSISYRLFYFMAQVLGLLEAVDEIENKKDQEGVYEYLRGEMEKSAPLYILESFDELAVALHTIMYEIDNWQDYKFLDKINYAINNFWKNCGFESDDDLYFKVIEE